MFCSKCGKTLEDAAAFCSACGAKVSGPANNDDGEKLDKYLKLAFAAVNAANRADALQYANKALEIAPEEHQGWVAKAKATAWGSTLNQNEVPAATGAAKNAVIFAPDELKTQVADDCYLTIKNIVAQLLNLAQSMPMAMVPAQLNTFTHVHTIMTQWIQLVSEIPDLSPALVAGEVQECQTLCKQSKSAIMPGKRKIYAASVAARIKDGYGEEMRRALWNKGIQV